MTVIEKFRMILISASLIHPVILPFIGSKWSDCHLGIQNGTDFVCLFHLVTLSFIVGKWSDCCWEIQNSTDICLSVLLRFTLFLFLSWTYLFFFMITHPSHVIGPLTTLVFVIISFHPIPQTSMTNFCLLICTSL